MPTFTLVPPNSKPISPLEKLLAKVAGEWSTTFDAIDDLVSVHDLDFNIVRCNKSFAAFFGFEPKKMIGKKCFDLMHGSDGAVDQCPHATAVEGECAVTREITVDHDTKIILSITCSPYFDDRGRLMGTVHIARDITEQKRVQEENENLLAKLQQTMAELKVLNGLLPICSYCKKIRDDSGYWQQLEGYIRRHSEADFSHGICPDCMDRACEEMGLDNT